ncbi:hypothetical protein FPQ18DRAFT_37568 [Pyronema domesticum]|nr:hypothetical protein FPQ18DRAFT_37568 [Pyronema domesticum]
MTPTDAPRSSQSKQSNDSAQAPGKEEKGPGIPLVQQPQFEKDERPEGSNQRQHIHDRYERIGTLTREERKITVLGTRNLCVINGCRGLWCELRVTPKEGTKRRRQEVGIHTQTERQVQGTLRIEPKSRSGTSGTDQRTREDILSQRSYSEGKNATVRVNASCSSDKRKAESTSRKHKQKAKSSKQKAASKKLSLLSLCSSDNDKYLFLLSFLLNIHHETCSTFDPLSTSSKQASKLRTFPCPSYKATESFLP